VAGIGFQLSGAESEVRPEREAAALIEDAASLLFVTDIMRGEAAGLCTQLYQPRVDPRSLRWM
jgi:hypothetical protein